MTPIPTISFVREELLRAARRLSPADLQVLVRLALLAEPVRGSLTSSWEGLTRELDLPRPALDATLERLRGRGYLQGRVDAPDGLHVHLDDLLAVPPLLPENLPFDEV